MRHGLSLSLTSGLTLSLNLRLNISPTINLNIGFSKLILLSIDMNFTDFIDGVTPPKVKAHNKRSEEHTSELQSH